jgi:hypothetical protein
MRSMDIYKRVKALIDNNIDLEKFNSDTGDSILGNYLIDETSGLDKLIESYNAARHLLKTFPKNPRPELIPLFVSLKDVKNIWTCSAVQRNHVSEHVARYSPFHRCPQQ